MSKPNVPRDPDELPAEAGGTPGELHRDTPPTPGPPIRAAERVTLRFQSILNVRLEAARSRTFRASDGGVQLRVGTTWLDSVNGEVLEPEMIPASNCTITLRKVADSSFGDADFGRANVATEGSSRLRWRHVPVGEYCFLVDTINRDPRWYLYIEMSVSTFSAAPPAPGGVNPIQADVTIEPDAE